MKVYVSYSFIDSELHLLTLLLEKLRKQGHIVETTNLQGDSFWNINNYKISSSDYFIGIVTNNSDSIKRVISEWNVAESNKVNSILLVEKGVKIDDANIQYFLFDRIDPQKTIDKLFQVQKTRKTGIEDALIGAGIILGIAALISILSKSSD